MAANSWNEMYLAKKPINRQIIFSNVILNSDFIFFPLFFYVCTLHVYLQLHIQSMQQCILQYFRMAIILWNAQLCTYIYYICWVSRDHFFLKLTGQVLWLLLIFYSSFRHTVNGNIRSLSWSGKCSGPPTTYWDARLKMNFSWRFLLSLRLSIKGIYPTKIKIDWLFLQKKHSC